MIVLLHRKKSNTAHTHTNTPACTHTHTDSMHHWFNRLQNLPQICSHFPISTVTSHQQTVFLCALLTASSWYKEKEYRTAHPLSLSSPPHQTIKIAPTCFSSLPSRGQPSAFYPRNSIFCSPVMASSLFSRTIIVTREKGGSYIITGRHFRMYK